MENIKKKNKTNLFSYFKDYKLISILAPLFKMLEAIFELFVPIIMSKIIDIGIDGNDTSYIIKMGLILLGLGILGMLCAISAQYFSAKSAVSIASRIKRDLFNHIMHLDFENIDQVGKSSLITRMTSDINFFQTGINMSLRLVLRSPFIVFGAMIMAYTIDKELSLIFVFLIPMLFLVVISIILITRPIYRNSQSKLDGVLNLTRENLSGARVIRAYAIEEKERNKNARLIKILEKIQIKGGILSYVMNPLSYVLINLAIVLMLYFSSIKINTGSLSQGSVIAFYNYMSQILVELIKLTNLVITISKALASKRRIEDMFEIENKEYLETVSSSSSFETLEFRNVSFKYSSSKDYNLKNISFKASMGEVIGIIGGTGAGKTTIASLINRFYPVSEGEVLINNENINNYPKEYLNENISTVLQKASMLNLTIEENIKLGAKQNQNVSDEELKDALNASCSNDIVSKKENGINEEILEGGKNLSGGEKQRLSIARGLIKGASILILDDSTSALDYLTDKRLRENLLSKENKPLIFIISQRCSSVKDADKIIVMKDGKVDAIGTHLELLKSSKEYLSIYESQSM